MPTPGMVIRLRRLRRTFAGAFALLAVILLAAVVVIFRLADLPPLRVKAVALLSQYVHGTVTMQALHLSLLPLPHVVLDGVSLSQPGSAAATIASVSVYPELRALLHGRLGLSTLSIDSPDVTLDRRAPASVDGAAPDSSTTLSESISTLLVPGASSGDLTIVLRNGQVRVATAGTTTSLLTGVDGRLQLRPQQTALELTCASAFAHSIAIGATLESGRAKFEAHAANVDVAAVHEAAGGLAGDVPAVRELFAILPSGSIPNLTLHSEAGSLVDLAGGAAMEIRGTLANAQIEVPGVDLELQEVGGEVSMRGGVLAAHHMVARLGSSQARDGTLRIDFGAAPPTLHVETAVEADVADLTPLLKRLAGRGLAAGLDQVSDMQGLITGKLTLGGTTADVSVAADVSQVKVSARAHGMKDPFHIDGGRLSYAAQQISAGDLTVSVGGSKLSQLSFNGDWKASRPTLAISVTGAKIVLDEVYPWLKGSGWLPDDSVFPPALGGVLELSSLTLNGPATAPAQWRLESTGAARDIAVDSPALRQWTNLHSGVSLAGAKLMREPGGRVTLSGTFNAPGDLRGAVDLLWDTGKLQISRLSVKDAESDATIALLLKGRSLDLRFDGKLGKTTLDGILANNPFPGGWVRGKFRSSIPLDEPARSTANGQLEAADVAVATNGRASLRAETLAIDAHGDSFDLRAELVSNTQSRVQVKGNVTTSSPDIVVDLDATGGILDWAAVESFLPASPETDSPTSSTAAAPPSVRGTIRVAVDSFSYERFTWKPLLATVLLAADATTVTITGADICGIATPGTITVTPAGLDIAFQPHAQHALDATLACLEAEKGLVTGQYSLRGSITGRGPASEISKRLHGEGAFEVSNGRIYRVQFAKTLLSVLSMVSGSVLNVTDVAKEGFEFEDIAFEAVLEGTTLQFHKLILKAPSAAMVGEGSIDMARQTIDLTLLVAPLKTVDLVISRIPLLGRLLGGTLVSIPVRISGPLAAPDVTPLSPTAVGQRWLGLMQSTIKLPVKILQPLLPEE